MFILNFREFFLSVKMWKSLFLLCCLVAFVASRPQGADERPEPVMWIILKNVYQNDCARFGPSYVDNFTENIK